jgi:acyl phosphate:glycerol-3-phosphate acyltransferase
MAIMVLLLAYLFGSVPAGAWISRLYKVDIQKVGSGNTGATNVFRTLGAIPGLAVLIFDVLKGGIAVLVARVFGVEGWLLGGVAVAAVLGHNYSMFLGFKGGKGVATSFGTMLFVSPLVALFGLPVFLVTVWLTRYVSAGSMLGAASVALLGIWMVAPLWQIITMILLATLIFWTHRDNIERLATGNERRFGEKKAAAPTAPEAASTFPTTPEQETSSQTDR